MEEGAKRGKPQKGTVRKKTLQGNKASLPVYNRFGNMGVEG